MLPTWLDDFTRRARSLASGDVAASIAGTLVEPIIASSSSVVVRATIELIRFRNRATKQIFALRVERFPTFDTTPFEQRGLSVTRPDGAIAMRDERIEILVVSEDGFALIEASETLAPLEPNDAVASLRSLDPLAPFAALTGGSAVLQSWGVGHDARLGPLGLVKVQRDLERTTEDEDALRAAGFTVDVDEGLWATPDGNASVVWMGGTVYGYVGPVPEESVGGWPP